MVMYHKAGYGNVTAIEGLEHVLAFAHTGDNAGPQSREHIVSELEKLRARFPGYNVQASTLDAFAAQLDPLRERLPLVEDEIGDTWIHGTGSDPWKVSRFRELVRLRARWLAEGRASLQDPALHRFSRELLTVAEHTWGLDGKTHLADFKNYARADFERARKLDYVLDEASQEYPFTDWFRRCGTPQSYRKIEASWFEQRAYLHKAVAALRETPLAAEAAQVLAAGAPARITRGEKLAAAALERPIELEHFQAGFHPATGALISLLNKHTGTNWAAPSNPLAFFRYQSLSSADYDRFLREYVLNLQDPGTYSWAVPDFARLGLKPEHSESAFFAPEITGVLRTADRFVFDLRLPERTRKKYGAPKQVQLVYTFPRQTPAVEIELLWFAKPASRLPEALWLSFAPAVAAPERWEIHKLGRWLSPLKVVSRGNRNMHGVNTGVRIENAGSRLLIESLDAHLVSPGEPRVLQFDNTLPPAGGRNALLSVR